MYDSKYFKNVEKYISNGDKVSYTGILVASKFNQKNGQDYPLVDLVDIDFNGAWISSLDTYLNTSYDLIYVLDLLNRSNEVGAIENEIQNIWNQIDEITSSYITYSSLDEILQSNWQRKLEAGSYISIDTTNPESYIINVDGLPTYDYLYKTYTSLNRLNELETFINENYYTKSGTENVAYEAAYDAILRVIDGADDAFDTLKEVSDWILSQNRYVEVHWSEVLNEWKDEYYFKEIFDEEGNGTGKYELVGSSDEIVLQSTSFKEYVQDNFQENYFFYIDSEGNYVPLTSPDNFVEGTEYWYCDNKYYIEENYLTDIQNLLDRVNRLDDTVGFKIYNGLTYTYSGHCLDIYNLQKSDAEQNLAIQNLSQDVTNISNKADNAYEMAYDAYVIAYTSYETANDALETAYEAIETSNTAYEIAYEAIERVGEPTINAHYSYFDKEGLTDEEYLSQIESYISEGGKVYYFYDDTVYEASLPLDPNEVYAYFVETSPGTGLTGRVEDVEDIANNAYEKSEAALMASYDALYHLLVNNDNSTYVNLSLHPDSYYGDRRRTIQIETQEASINSKTGEVYSNGLVNLSCAFDIYSYASSWMMLYVDQDVDFEDTSNNDDEQS